MPTSEERRDDHLMVHACVKGLVMEKHGYVGCVGVNVWARRHVYVNDTYRCFQQTCLKS